MDTVISIIVLIALLIVAWIIVRFLLKITGCILYAVLTGILAVGILIVLWIFFF
jgi:hypothetical protein